VSLKSAKAMLVRLQGIIEPFEPERFMELGEAHLRSLGVTRQKSAYLIDLSTSIVNGDLSFA
jgi:3-methyladenine DNA glycosylase/8-oxoguanine DNA glycosylase